MVPFHLQLELSGRRSTLLAEQLDPLTDENGFLRYQIRTFNHASVIYVNIETTGAFSEEEVFSLDDIQTIAEGIREYYSSRQLNFDQLAFDF